MDETHTPSRTENAPSALWTIAAIALAPFPVSAIAYAYGEGEQARMALRVLLTWSTVVLSFLGGVRWGLETGGRVRPRWTRLAASVVSPVAAWGLYLARNEMGVTWSITGFLTAFLLQWLFDHRAPDAPARYPRLSTTMTAGACVSLALALQQALHS